MLLVVKFLRPGVVPYIDLINFNEKAADVRMQKAMELSCPPS